MSKLSLNLSDDLARLAVNFDEFTRGGIAMDGDTVSGLVATLRALHRAARDFENEISRHRWNDSARRDRNKAVAKVLDIATAPGSNVALFPVIRRPIQGDAPAGAA